MTALIVAVCLVSAVVAAAIGHDDHRPRNFALGLLLGLVGLLLAAVLKVADQREAPEPRSVPTRHPNPHMRAALRQQQR